MAPEPQSGVGLIEFFKMTTIIKLSLLTLSVVVLSACVSTSKSVAVRDIDELKTTPPQLQEPTKQEPTKQETTKQAPVYQERTPRVLPIVERLFDQADAALNNSQWEQAIALAEKGLRIERKDPRFYWVLATAYAQLSNKKQSQSFAKQGLRFAPKNSDLARQLSRFLP